MMKNIDNISKHKNLYFKYFRTLLVFKKLIKFTKDLKNYYLIYIKNDYKTK